MPILKILIHIFAFALTAVAAVASPMELPLRYRTFDNIDDKIAGVSVRCMVHAPDGNIWIGGARGVYSFDGYNLQWQDSRQPTGTVNSMLLQNERIYLACDNGLFFIDLRYSSIVKVELPDISYVEDLAFYRGRLILATHAGLYECQAVETDSKADGFFKVDNFVKNDNAPAKLMSLEIVGHQLFVGGFDSLGIIDLISCEYSTIECERPFVVSDFKKDSAGDVLWIGTGWGLLTYDLAQRKIIQIDQLPVVKAIEQDKSGCLLLGTDNGLFISDGNGEFASVCHDARFDKSLAGEEVWDISTDREGNIWFGTENGMSVSPDNPECRVFNLPSITGSGKGNMLVALCPDDGDCIWLGGNGGILYATGTDKEVPSIRWFNMSDPGNFIPHNRVRAFYRGPYGCLWGATDRGLVCYDAAEERFMSVEIKDESYWIYGMDCDNEGRMWVATFSGVHAIECQSVADNMQLSPIKSFRKKDGLRNENVGDLAFDGHNGLWTLAKGYVDHINPTTGEIKPAPFPKEVDGKISRILVDRQHTLWAASSGRLFCLNNNSPGVEDMRAVTLFNPEETGISAMGDVDDEIWVATKGRLFKVNKNDLSVSTFMTDENIASISQDPVSGYVWLGSFDKFLRVDRRLGLSGNKYPIEVTGIKVNGIPYPIDPQDMAVELSHADNTLDISFTDHRSVGRHFSNLIYKLEGSNEGWLPLSHGVNSVSLAHLSSGSYQFLVAHEGDHLSAVPLLRIKIRPVWYLSWWAAGSLLLLAAVCGMWVMKHVRMRHNLEKEKKLRQLQIEQEKDKMHFLTNLALEYKSPLSLIMSVLGQLRNKIPGVKERELLEMAQSSTMRLSSLITLSLDTYNNPDFIDTPIRKRLDIVEFVKGIVGACKDKTGYDYDVDIKAARSPMYVYADVYKMDIILSNIVTNACRIAVVNARGIFISIDEESEMLCFFLAISHRGSAPDNNPYSTGIYPDTDAAPIDAEGDVVSLAVVKEYINLRNGEFEASSENGVIRYVVKLPLDKDEYLAAAHQDNGPVHSDEQPECNNATNKPTVVIVEPNEENSGFLENMLSDEYNCLIAHNGNVGVRLCRESVPDLIVTVRDMPVMDGICMCREIRKFPEMGGVPIVLMTRRQDNALAMQCIQLNIDAVIPTPVDYSFVKAKISQLIARRRDLERRVRIENISVSDVMIDISSDEKFLKKVISAIEGDISDPEMSVEWLSQKTGISEKQLYRKIKKLTGLTTSEYIRETRLDKGAVLLRESDLSISEIMYMVGFSHASYFSSCFRKKFGMSPKEYRATVSSKQNNPISFTLPARD